MSELKAIESATAVIENVHLVYRMSEADKVIAELKAREDVLVTDNRNLLDKVKKLENHLRENAEHFKRNEAQIIEASDNEIKKLKDENERLEKFIQYIKDDANKIRCYAQSLNKEHRLAQHALWLARTKRAIEKIAWFRLWNASISTMNPEDGARQEFDKWRKNLGMFLKKAEEYK